MPEKTATHQRTARVEEDAREQKATKNRKKVTKGQAGQNTKTSEVKAAGSI